MELNYRAITRVLGLIVLLLTFAMLPFFFLSLAFNEFAVSSAFLAMILPMAFIGALIHRFVHPRNSILKIREGFLTVALCWIVASFVGALLYQLSGVTVSFVDALFESTSGFTTTGATIFRDVEILPKSLLLWRSFTQWLGGMGILVFAISLLPALGISGMHIARAESPGPTLDKVAAKISDSAKILYLMYLILTVVEFLLLAAGGMSAFDSLVFTFGSVASGGLTNYNDGIAHFNSAYIETVISVFTIFACINFTHYYDIFQGKWKRFLKDAELRVFLMILGAAGLVVALNLYTTGTCDSILQSVRDGFFQVTAFLTTTGHSTADYNLWPTTSRIILFILMFIGGCSASTGGSIKVIRIMVMFKMIRRGFYRKLHPRAVIPIKLQGHAIPTTSVTHMTAFIIAYLTTLVFSAVVLSFQDLDWMSSLSTSASILGNIGVGFGSVVGSSGCFAAFEGWAKLYLCGLMMAGRLEVFTILLMLAPSFWNPDK